MKRHFYISDDLNDLELVEQDLQIGGVKTPQIHVLSYDDAGVENHHLHKVESVLTKNVVHSMEMGAALGLFVALLMLFVAHFAGWAASEPGWMPFIFLSIIILGFFTWEGGLFGIQEPHYQFKQFSNTLKDGNHVLFVDVSENQEPILANVVNKHPRLQLAGFGQAAPEMLINWRNNWHNFMKNMP